MLLVSAGFTDLGSSAPSVIMYLPEGEHTISAKVDGRPQEARVNVTEEAAALLQSSLEARLQQNVRAIVDFDHNDTGPAAALPKRFFWEPGKGVMLELDWTRAGKQSIEGRDYSYFSPLFYVDDKGRPVRLDEQRPVGALVNDPAFRSIERIAAANARITKPTKKSMSQPDFSILVEAGAIKAEEAKSDNAVAAIAAAYSAKVAELKAAQDSLEAVTQERDAAQSEIRAAREAEADSAVSAAVEAGRLAAKDEESQKFWRDLILEKGAPAIKQLEAKAEANPGISQPVVKRRGGPDVPGQTKSVEAARAAQIRNRAAQIQKDQKVTYSQAWNRAAAEIPA